MQGRFSITCGPPLKRANAAPTQQKKRPAAKPKKKTTTVEPTHPPNISDMPPSKNVEKSKQTVQTKVTKKTSTITPRKTKTTAQSVTPSTPKIPQHQNTQIAQTSAQQQQQQQNSQIALTTTQQQQLFMSSPQTSSISIIQPFNEQTPMDHDELIDTYDQLASDYKNALEKRKDLQNERKRIRAEISKAYHIQSEIEREILDAARQRLSFQTS